MTQRERILAIAVGGVLVLIGMQWALNRFRDARSQRDLEISRLESELQTAQSMQLAGLAAADRMSGFIERSLPANADAAVNAYMEWLYTLMDASGVSGTDVRSLNSTASGDLYRVYNYRVSASGDMEEIVWLLHAFHRTDYLHRITTLGIKPNRGSSLLNLSMSIQVLAMNDAAEKQPPPERPSPLIDDDVEKYVATIVNRNYYAPPNQPPRYSGEATVEAVVDADFRFKPNFEDPDGDEVSLRLIGDVPDGVGMDEASGEIRVRRDELGDLTLLVEARDSGRPARIVEQELTISVVEPPATEEPMQTAFDDATQAFVTALIYSRGSWKAWVTVRTRGEKLELQAGDDFEIGELSGKVVDVTQRFVELEVDDRRFTVGLDGNLAEAAKQSLVD
ncbi:cadherin repeat domain-containing protein [Roseimaritima sediminicola]|uniref:cadherin repeat domain-containing protein n=1 Tax=Roseimaritima sediminicola TaxID=2662066 RepID=UPI0012982E3F|nr:cadherin repeat domain-containing protein [Roseimaritima sediminicola]